MKNRTPYRQSSAGALLLLAAASSATAQTPAPKLLPNNLVVSRSVYDNKASNVTVGQVLPPNCAQTAAGCPAGASAGAPFNGSYPYVFNNAAYDGSFGITSRIYLDQISLLGAPVSSLEVPNSDEGGSGKHLVTSFSSKSELALHLSTDNQHLTFMGYVAPVNTLDVSNSNTPLAIDPTNPDGQTPYYRAVARVGKDGGFSFTETNAYSGNNGRSAILNDSGAMPVFYTAGNAGNGGSPQPNGILDGAGAQLIVPATVAEAAQNPGLPTPLASFSVTELGQKADKVGKDDNFRGQTIFNNVLYYTKGSGGNGVNTVYFVDTVGGACPNGVGLPKPGATLPTASLPTSAADQTAGLPSNMCILAGFPTALAKNTTNSFPFGLWFADANTLYVADEGDGYVGADLYTHAAAQTTAGLQKWVFSAATETWKLAYVIKEGLNIGTPYTVPGYPTGTNTATSLPWAPTTDGLRNLTGLVGPDGLVAIWATTSTTSGGGDTGADPNKLFVTLDVSGNTDPALGGDLPFVEVKDAGFGEVLRGVSLTPGTDFTAFANL